VAVAGYTNGAAMADFWQRDDAEKTRRSGNGGLRLTASWFCELWRLIRAGARWCCKGGSGNTTVKMVTACMKDVGGCCSGEGEREGKFRVRVLVV